MAGLCEGGSEPPGSLKATHIRTLHDTNSHHFPSKREALPHECSIVPGLHLRTFEEPRMTAETAPSTVAPPGGEAGSKYQYYDPEYARMEAWLDEHPDFVQDYFLSYRGCSLCGQEGDAAGGGHLAGVSCDALAGQHQQLHHPSERGPVIPQPPGEPRPHVRLVSACQHCAVLQDRIRGHHARPQDLGARVRAGRSSQADRQHHRRDPHLPVGVPDGGLPRHLHQHQRARLHGRHPPVPRPRPAAEAVPSRVEAPGREGTHLRVGMCSCCVDNHIEGIMPDGRINRTASRILTTKVLVTSLSCSEVNKALKSASRVGPFSFATTVRIPQVKFCREKTPSAKVKDICNELDVRSLCHKILQNVSMLLNADRGSLFLVQGDRGSYSDNPRSISNNTRSNNPRSPNPAGSRLNNATGNPRQGRNSPVSNSRPRYLVSKLFDVCSRSTLQEMEKKEEIRIPWGTGIVGYVAESGEPVNIPDAYKAAQISVKTCRRYLMVSQAESEVCISVHVNVFVWETFWRTPGGFENHSFENDALKQWSSALAEIGKGKQCIVICPVVHQEEERAYVPGATDAP
ncbi:hypothetical protein ANN_15674 [Periplaneta americana]|uniref:GAF domain-containing protein n=1 Tax=Periplaneta americana TaxID=6978 RepID=A0ABQ8SI04_PERAM|nr:hypothetical protein ANN_15674 [Periplaneta americana]